jgi:hypothetical protein
MNNIVNEYLLNAYTTVYTVRSSFRDHELNFSFTLVTVFINTVQLHIINYNNKKSCWFLLTLLCLVNLS